MASIAGPGRRYLDVFTVPFTHHLFLLQEKVYDQAAMQAPMFASIPRRLSRKPVTPDWSSTSTDLIWPSVKGEQLEWATFSHMIHSRYF